MIIQVEESEPVKKDRKIENRSRYKGPDNKRTYRSDRTDGKDAKDRTLDPMDPASYSDIPRYVFLFTKVHRLTYVYLIKFLFIYNHILGGNGQTDWLNIMKLKLVLTRPLRGLFIK